MIESYFQMVDEGMYINILDIVNLKLLQQHYLMSRTEIVHTHQIHEQENTPPLTWLPERGDIEWYLQSWASNI